MADASVHPNTPTPQRKTPHPDADPHVGWGRRARDLEARLAETPEPEEGDDSLYDEIDRLRDLIGTTPAHTVEGALEQVLRAIRMHDLGCVLDDAEDAGLRNVAATLERLATNGGRA